MSVGHDTYDDYNYKYSFIPDVVTGYEHGSFIVCALRSIINYNQTKKGPFQGFIWEGRGGFALFPPLP